MHDSLYVKFGVVTNTHAHRDLPGTIVTRPASCGHVFSRHLHDLAIASYTSW